MKAEFSIEQIEKETGVKFPDELKNYYESVVLPADKNEGIIINCKHLINDWKYNYDFYVLKEGENKLHPSHLSSKKYANQNSIITASKAISSSMNANVLCFAWSYDTVEKDTGLFYMEDGNIYGYSGNFSDNYQPDLITKDFNALFNLNAADRILKIEEIVQPKNWFYSDQERAGTVQDYESIIADFFIKTADNRLVLQIFKGAEIEQEKRKLTLRINHHDFEFLLDTNRGWIDSKIIDLMNNAIKVIGIHDKEFVEIREYTWGQEWGVAFVTEKERAELARYKYLKS